MLLEWGVPWSKRSLNKHPSMSAYLGDALLLGQHPRLQKMSANIVNNFFLTLRWSKNGVLYLVLET
jgi:hypothetical protein